MIRLFSNKKLRIRLSREKNPTWKIVLSVWISIKKKYFIVFIHTFRGLLRNKKASNFFFNVSGSNFIEPRVRIRHSDYYYHAPQNCDKTLILFHWNWRHYVLARRYTPSYRKDGEACHQLAGFPVIFSRIFCCRFFSIILLLNSSFTPFRKRH